MDKINEAIKKAEEEKEASWWKKAFGWIASVVTAIVAVATLVVGIATANPLLIVGGLAACYFAASSLTEQITGKGLTQMALEACGVPEDVARWIGMGIDLVGGLAAGICSGVGFAKLAEAALKGVDVSAKIAKISAFAAKVTKIANVIQGAAGIGGGVSGGFAAKYRYDSEKMRADQLDLKKALEKLLVEDQECQKAVKAILEFFKNMTDDVNQIVKDKNMSASNVMSMGPASGGMA